MNHVSDKFTLLRELVKGKTVLDIGCVQHSWKKSLEPNWIHNVLRNSAKSVKGIDILKEDVEILKQMGYDVEYGDAENFLGHDGKPRQKYDLVFMGELIEHLSNQGKCLDCCFKSLEDNGKLVLTTVNCFSLLYMVLFIFKKLQVNNEHTCWYDEVTLRQILKRYGFKTDQVYYFHRYEMSNNPLKRVVMKIFDRLCPYRMRDNILIVASIDKLL